MSVLRALDPSKVVAGVGIVAAYNPPEIEGENA
jgi:hypothetical protein